MSRIHALQEFCDANPFIRYQAGEGIYELFDKVLVLDKGRQVYFGPPSEARRYFEQLGYKSLPRQSTADYLTGCTDPNERQFAPGRSAADVPSSPEALESVFSTSSLAKTNADNLLKYKASQEAEKRDQETFRAAVAEDKKRGVSKKSPYTVGFTGQVKALAIRQFQMRMQDRFQLVTSYALSIVSFQHFLTRFVRLTKDITDPWYCDRCCVFQSTAYGCWRVHPGFSHLRRVVF